MQKIQLQLHQAENVVKKNSFEIAGLKNTLAESEGYRKSQQQELDIIKNQRDILAQQIVKKSKEILILVEKNKVAKSVRKKRHHDFTKIIEAIELIRTRIVAVNDQTDVCKKDVSVIPELRRDKIKLESELNKLEIKNKALSDDCEVRINIHFYNNLMKTKPEV